MIWQIKDILFLDLGIFIHFIMLHLMIIYRSFWSLRTLATPIILSTICTMPIFHFSKSFYLVIGTNQASRHLSVLRYLPKSVYREAFQKNGYRDRNYVFVHFEAMLCSFHYLSQMFLRYRAIHITYRIYLLWEVRS